MSEGRLIPVFAMYFIAGYIKKYVRSDKNNSIKHFMIAVLGYLLLYASFVGIQVIGNILQSEKIMSYCYFWRPLNSPIVLVINIEMFLAFLRMKSKQSKIVNAIASNTFGVYLIHANQVISSVLLPKIFPVYMEKNPLKVFIYSIGTVIIVYAMCTIIDIIRQKTVEKLWVKYLNDKCDMYEEATKKLIHDIGKKIVLISEKYYE